MRILIDIGHPAHVHLFRNFIIKIREKHYVIVTVKSNNVIAKQLLKFHNIDYIQIGQKSDSLFLKAFNQIKYNLEILKIQRKHKISIGIGTSVTIAHVSKISKMTSIVFDDDDDDVQKLFVKFVHPFCDTLLTPDALKSRRKKDTIFYKGYHDLAYLHPNRFQPHKEVLSEIGIKENERFFILRFNSFKAFHDSNEGGLNTEQKKELIELLENYGKILISSEREIDKEFTKYQLKVSPEKIHSVINFSTMFLGDSQSMISEAAILGIPALKCNSFAGKLSVPNEIEEKYELCYSYQPTDFKQFINKITELLSMPNLKEIFQQRRQKMLADKIDVTAFMVWFIENYPQSAKIIKENPNFQYNFR